MCTLLAAASADTCVAAHIELESQSCTATSIPKFLIFDASIQAKNVIAVDFGGNEKAPQGKWGDIRAFEPGH